MKNLGICPVNYTDLIFFRTKKNKIIFRTLQKQCIIYLMMKMISDDMTLSAVLSGPDSSLKELENIVNWLKDNS